MRKIQKVAVALISLSAMCLAAPAASDSQPVAKKHQAGKPAKRDETAEKLRDLQEKFEQQQAAMQQMQQQLQQTQQQLQQTQLQVTQAQQTAQQADAKIATVESNTNLQVQKAQADVSDVKTALNTTQVTVAKNEKAVTELEHPNTIAFKGIRITPGGFLDLSAVYRTHATNSSMSTIFNAVPLGNQAIGAVGNLSEFSTSARGSRITLRADADAGKTKVAGFFEMDFYGNTFATPNQTAAYGLRIRQAWGRARFENGFSVTGGQMWNLVTMSRRAADADATWIPNTIDSNYLVGFDWGREGELRMTQNLSKSISLTLGLIDPAYLSTVNNTNGTVAGLASAGAGNLGNSAVTSCTSGATSALPATGTTGNTACVLTDTYSTNVAPDLVVKLAYDSPRAGHYEVKGLQRFFRDRVVATGRNNDDIGYGIGGGAIVPVVRGKVDFIVQGLYGKGVSRYQDSGQFDFVVRTNTLATGSTTVATTIGADNNLIDIKGGSGVVGFETHPGTRTEFDVYYGDEYYGRTTYRVTSIATGLPVVLGYGNTNGSANRNLGLGTAVLWYDVYKGRFGTLRYGAQYEYAYRTTWATGGDKAPKGIDNIGYLAMRYILP